MARIQIGGAGGAPSNNFIRSLRDSNRVDYLIGTSSTPSDLFLADTNEKHVVPMAISADYNKNILELVSRTRPDFIHVQNDFEVRAVARIRDELEFFGVRTYLPNLSTIENCVDKLESFKIWKANGVHVPDTILLQRPKDLRQAFDTLGRKIWIRAIEGGGGRGALPAENYEFARIWIDNFKGWGQFTASELLSPRSVTWQSIWYQGELVVAQSRRRHSWNFGNRTVSGVTGITGVGETFSDESVNSLALEAILAIDYKPHGIFSVDMTYDFDDKPRVTEINIGRFFTTHYFFTKAGLNFPEIYCNIALEGTFPSLSQSINPLPDGLVWIRGMDKEPVLTTSEELKELEEAANLF